LRFSFLLLAMSLTGAVIAGPARAAVPPPPDLQGDPDPLAPPEDEPEPLPAPTVAARSLEERIKQCDTSLACMPGRWVFQYHRLTNFSLDASGLEHDQIDVGRQLIRLHPMVNFGSTGLTLHGEVDVISGRTFGDLNRIATDALLDPDDTLDAWGSPDTADYRSLYLEWRSPAGVLRLGHQTSRWGLGLIANDGNDEEHDLFDYGRYGDIVERVMFVTAPFGWKKDAWAKKLLLIGGFDVVFRDENADLVAGDLALQGVVSLLWRDVPEEGSTRPWSFTAGAYVAIRDQEDDDGDTLEARAYDLHLRYEHFFAGPVLWLAAGAELVFLEGRTNRARLEQAQDGLDLLALGVAFQAQVMAFDLGLEGRLDVGYASGDEDRNDGTSRAFSFDPDYHVGMILFSEVMSRISARSVENARNPELLAEAPKGLELLPSDGAITNAIYVSPTVRYMSSVGLGVDLQGIFAWSDAPLADAWQTAKNGGFAANHLGATPDSSYLGTEVDVGLRYEHPIADRVWVKLLVQGGFFFPGGALDAPDGKPSMDTVSKVRAAVELGW
jgi:hypothetical protein